MQYPHLFDYRAFPRFTSAWKQKQDRAIRQLHYHENSSSVFTHLYLLLDPHDIIVFIYANAKVISINGLSIGAPVAHSSVSHALTFISSWCSMFNRNGTTGSEQDGETCHQPIKAVAQAEAFCFSVLKSNVNVNNAGLHKYCLSVTGQTLVPQYSTTTQTLDVELHYIHLKGRVSSDYFTQYNEVLKMRKPLPGCFSRGRIQTLVQLFLIICVNAGSFMLLLCLLGDAGMRTKELV